MHQFRHILYIYQPEGTAYEGLKQALSLARNHEAALHILTICPPLAKAHATMKEMYENALREEMTAHVKHVKEAMAFDGDVSVTISVMHHDKPATAIIQEILNKGYDLLIKEVEGAHEQHGFKALDMSLLRKCPCPVLLARPISKPRKDINIAVAIDPENTSNEATHMALRMLSMARALADDASATLHVLSCWNCHFDSYARNSAWIKVSHEEIDENVEQVRHEHRAALDGLIEASNIEGNIVIHHVRGKAENTIPSLLKTHNMDVLVMGTLARTGIPGIVIGNTSENILREITCSLIALKPGGFVSPIKAN